MTVKFFFKSLLPPIVLFTLHVFAIVLFNIYSVFPNFDILMHFLGGCTIGITAVMWYRQLVTIGMLPRLPLWLSLFFLTAIVAFVAVGWEWAEYLADTYLGTFMQVGLRDTMGDLALGTWGGFLTGLVLLWKNR
jgi:hypothetical protein